jgi:hypothetical protein
MGAKLAWGLVVVVAILHYDFWNWGDHHLVFGFMPLGLAYHAGISLAAGLAWTLVVLCAWPDEVEEWASGAEPGAASGGERAGDTDRA